MRPDNNNFDAYYKLYEKARTLEKIDNIDEALNIYLDILLKYEPIGTSYYERPAIILEKQKNYAKSLEICELVLNNSKRFTKPTWKSAKESFIKRKNRLLIKIERAQSSNTKSNKTIKKEKTSLPVAPVISNNLAKEINYPNWYISISFGMSKSDNFVQALAIAKTAPQFIENNVEGKILYQAIYSDSPSEYLQFIKLYELVSQWKSCFVVINGRLIDRKIIGKLNYCYGDKCRSGNKNFCYGASELTENPFGCHRLQISTGNNPWWTISTQTNKGYIINRQLILDRIKEKSLPYLCCPSFDIDMVTSVVHNLPFSITFNDYEKLERDRVSAGGIIINVSMDYSKENNNETLNISNTKAEPTSLLKRLIKIFTK